MTRSDLLTALSRLSRQPDYSAYTAAAHSLDQGGAGESQFPALRLAVLQNFTLDPLLPVIKGEIALAGFYPVVYSGGHDTIGQDVMNPHSALYAFKPDVIIVAQWLEALAPLLTTRFMSLSTDQVHGEIERIVTDVSELLTFLRRHTQAPILVNNFPLPPHVTLGILDAQSKHYQGASILTLNEKLQSHLRQIPDVYLVDYLGLMGRVGSAQGLDERYWQIGRAPIGRHALVPLGQQYGKYIRALRGKARKCLVIDCDNILWGGVVGEEGPEGIKLGPNYPGSCYQAFQNEVLNLHDRGVILALCSKNNEADVLEVLRQHPEMILREKHFSTWQINWDDKATNLARIAQDLNIGLDSLVFVDDNPFECDWVRERLPEVSVLQLDSEPSSFRSKLSDRGYFDTLVLSTEDKARPQLYRQETERRNLRASASSLEDFLTKMGMVAEIRAADDMTVPRVTQLIQKTNQFNLTTQRYTEGEIRAYMESSQADVFCLKLRDRLSDMGLVGVAIVRYDNGRALVDTFLLSCRVLGRGVEDALLAHVLSAAKKKGCRHVMGRYLPSKKNDQVAKFYSRHGFHLLKETSLGSDWELGVEDHEVKGPIWIELKRNESEEKTCNPMSKN